ncbi:hypothetical protein F4778DRAFT_572430 [Xylariomycetidae sp. FL2044]|nr:hypothetical protein F4778DRAFT_572430 [Xylariomycetidae sp. FL2044]
MSSSITRALVVGGTSGIGYGIACRIAGEVKSSTVIISGRTKPDATPHINIEFRKLDASSMRAIKTYTDAYKSAQEPKLDLLVLTQGILSVAGRTETAEGIDRKMALHHYGKQLLIRELLPAMKDDAKVLIVLDGRSGSPAKLNWEDLDLKKTFSLARAADHCLSMNDAMIRQYAAEQQGGGAKRHFVHAFPGFVNSGGVHPDMPFYVKGPLKVLGSVLGVSTETCAEHMMRGTYEGTRADAEEGRFFSYIDNKGVPISKKAPWSDAQRQKVVDHTWKIVDDALKVEG